MVSLSDIISSIELFEKFSARFDWQPVTNISAKYGSHAIEVQRDGLELRLFIDNELVETQKAALAPNPAVALLRGTIVEDNSKAFVKVFGKSGFLRSKVKICVNDAFVAGDSF